jgi:CIC family chloride channel protein
MKQLRRLAAWLVIGVGAAATAVGAREFIVWFGSLLHGGLPPWEWGGLAWWQLLWPLAAGGLLVGLISRYDWELISGAGLDDTLECYHRRGGAQRPADAPLKLTASLIGLGSGISGGLMGPLTYAGLGLGGWIGRALRLDPERFKTAGLCGMAAALTAITGAPLGSALFTTEVLFLRHLEYRRFFPVLLSSLAAHLLTRLTGFYRPLFRFTLVEDLSPRWELIGGVWLSIGAGLVVAALFSLSMRAVAGLHEKLDTPKVVRPLLGALAGGALVVALAPELAGRVLSLGATEIQTLNAAVPVPLLTILILLGLKTACVSLAVGSGASVGLLAPAVYLGSLVGALAADACGLADQPLFMAAGVTVVLVTLTNAPLAAAVMMVEVFGPSVLIPVTLAGLIGNLAGRRLVAYHSILSWRGKVDLITSLPEDESDA